MMFGISNIVRCVCNLDRTLALVLCQNLCHPILASGFDLNSSHAGNVYQTTSSGVLERHNVCCVIVCRLTGYTCFKIYVLYFSRVLDVCLLALLTATRPIMSNTTITKQTTPNPTCQPSSFFST